MRIKSTRHRVSATLVGAGFLLGGAFPAMAQDAAPELALVDMSVRAFASLPAWHERDGRPCCYTELVAEEGMELVEFHLTLDVPWSEDLDRIRANSDEILVALPDGSMREQIGHFEYVGQFVQRNESLSVSRPRDWETEDRHAYIDPVFLLPEGTPSVVLHVGEMYSATVEIPETGPVPVPAEMINVEIRSANLLESVVSEDTVNDQSLANVIQAPKGMEILEIEVAIEALVSNQTDDSDRFNWHTHQFAVVFDGLQAAGLLGERFIDKLLQSQFNGVGVGASPATRVMYFALPKGATDLTLYFGDTEIAPIVPQ